MRISDWSSDVCSADLDKLVTMLQDPEFGKILVFGETKYGVQRLSDHLERQGINSVAIHGNKSQSQRKRALKSFKENEARVMEIGRASRRERVCRVASAAVDAEV